MADKSIRFVDSDGNDVLIKAHDNGDGTYSLSVGATGLVPITSEGESIVLLPSAARGATVGTNGTAFPVPGRVAFAILLEFTAKADDVDDTCNVYIDMLVGSTWINAIHFTQVLGNAADASKEYALLMPSAQSTPIVATGDAGSGVIRPMVIGSQIRARWVIVDPTGADASFTFAVTAWAL